MVHVTLPNLSLLILAAFCAGTVDAIAGGGGLLTVPALLAVGLPPHFALGTNKGQSVFGSLAAIFRYAHAGLIDRRAARLTAPLGFLGSLAGAALVMVLKPDVLRPVVLVLLIIAALVVTTMRPKPGGHAGPLARHGLVVSALAALVIGAYDGFFGPGTGTFLIAVSVGLLGTSMTRASADAKVVNFASNAAAVILFAERGVVVWTIALPMAGAQLCGGFLGAHFAVRRGARLIQGVVLLVVLAFVLKIGRDIYLGR